ncbi:MAG TPA: hypothetical protein VLI05_06095 [Candidatus Saccharimonadia bacterium]|nr:hypothetical protein [Candidatus Saccharimonadia bacterium]
MNSFRTRLIIIGAAIIAVIVGIILMIAQSASHPAASPSPTVATYKNSGPSYVGISLLSDRGFTDQQVAGVKFALYRFFKQVGQNPKQVTITNAVHVHYRNVATDYLTFDVLLSNNANYHARADYTDLESTKVTITDPQSNKTLFDSGVVKVNVND